MKQKQKFVETISGINVSNGVVKIYFINEDEENLSNGLDNSIKNNSNFNRNSFQNHDSLKSNFNKTNQNNSSNNPENNSPNNNQKIFMKHDHTLIMPISGFMYDISSNSFNNMVSVIKNLLENSQMQEQIEKYIEAGLLPKLEPQTNSFDQENQDD